MLPSTPPRFTSWAALVAPIRVGETGWRVYGLQQALTALGRRLNPDGDFGSVTEGKVSAFQAAHDLVVDGIAGGATQRLLISLLGSATHERLAGVPDGLMRGFAEGEGANVLGATNWTVAGGVDCGTMQYRALGPPFDPAMLQFAFDPLRSMLGAGRAFLERADNFAATGAWLRSLTTRRVETTKRVAIMAHNWPAGARSIADHGQCYNPGGLATWVAAGTSFPDGTPVRTRGEWTQFYAMGGVHGKASICKYVRDWS